MFLTFNLLSEGLSTFIFLVVNSYFSCPPPTLKVLGYYLGWAKIRLLLSPYANPPRSFLFWPRIGPSFSDLGCLGGPAGLWFLVRNPVELDAPCGLADWSLPWPLCCYTYWLDRLLFKGAVFILRTCPPACALSLFFWIIVPVFFAFIRRSFYCHLKSVLLEDY